MTLDPSIILGVKPAQFDDPLNSLGKVLQLKNAQQEGQLGALKMDEYKRGVADDQALSDAYKSAVNPDGSINRNSLYTTLAKNGQGKKLPTVQEGFAKQDKAATETDAAKFKLATERHDYFKKTLGALAQDPDLSKDKVAQAGLGLVQQGILPQSLYDQTMASMPDDPAQLRSRLVQGVKSQMTPEQIFTVFAPKAEKIDTGGRILLKDTNPNSPTFGQMVGGAPIDKEQSPDNKATVSASRENAAATREVAKATRDAATIQTGFSNEQSLRKEFEGLPEVKNYKQAYPAFAAIKDAASRNTTQSDINIVYGLAKLYDPTSVVREGEYATVANSPNIPEKVKGYAQYLAGGGKLSPGTKAQILKEAQGRIGTYEAEAKKAKGSYEGIARKRGMDPAAVFADMGDMTQGTTAPDTSVLDKADAILAGGKK